MRLTGLGLLSALALGGCATPASDAAIGAAQDAYKDCLMKRAAQLDDGKSDPRSIAGAVAAGCGVERYALADLLTQGQPPAYQAAMKDQSDLGATDDATAVVLTYRKQKH